MSEYLRQLRALELSRAVSRALQMAHCVPARKGAFIRVAVADERGELIALHSLRGEQLSLFREQLAFFGFADCRDHYLASERGCDIVLQRLHADPPVELVTPGERWPPDSLPQDLLDTLPHTPARLPPRRRRSSRTG